MAINSQQLKENTILLYERVKIFIAKEHYKLFRGFTVINGYLIIDIGNEQSVHVNPSLDLIVLVDNLTNLNTNFLSEESVATLNRLIDFAKISADAYYYYRTGFMRFFDSLMSYKIDNSADMYFRAESFIYKMYLTFYISQNCFSEKGVYKFKLPKSNRYLLISNINYYWTNDGIYSLETVNLGVTEYIFDRPDSREILNAIKVLCENPNQLQNLAAV